ncbi:MAG TPA: phosphoribosyltransferase family protein [Chloroflexia bacterium]|nr:phosphoribosyltransferase family protein [Chloroflexia bacterium]
MDQELLNLLSAREGHFRLESGHHGGLWLDLDPLFVMPARIQPFVEALAARLKRHHIQAVCGPLVGGAFLAQAVASLLDVEFYYAQRFAPVVRDANTLYPVEYRIPGGVGSMVRGKTVAVVDDAISAGSAVRGTLAALEANGAKPVALAALLVLGTQAERFCREHGLALEYIAQLPYEVWLPTECPLCASDVILEDMGAP